MATSNETATYIGNLSDPPTVPDDSLAGGRSRGGAEIRKAKQIMKKTFPNCTGEVSATHTELNILDGVTATTAELNILDGVTATAAELNILDGVTSTAAELNILDGVTATTAELNILDGVTGFIDDDTMATASATTIASSESVKAYADSLNQGMTMVAAASVGTSGDVSQALSGTVERIEVAFGNVSTNGTGDIRIQLGTGSALTTSGYESSATDANFTNNSTVGIIIHARSLEATDTYCGVATLVHMGSNLWTCSGTAFDATLRGLGQAVAFSGVVTLAGACDIVGIDTANSFDGGFWKVSYQTS